MSVSSRNFPGNAKRALADAQLQRALDRFYTGGLRSRRRQAVDALPEFESLRECARDIREHTLRHLDYYLERFEERVLAQGGLVHWCETPAEARAAVLEICREAGARSATKGKSMISEEIALNAYLERHGVEPVETDLGEFIVQLARETPSHLLAPAVHKSREDIARLFHEHRDRLGLEAIGEDGPSLVAAARRALRQRYFDAEVGITGANFLIAETGSCIVVTNEGNADLTMSLPDVHVVVTSIEKVVPTLEDAALLLRLLARSATGQEASVYTTFVTGPRRAEDIDGPGQYHVVLLDNGRSELLGSPIHEVLRCIRCSACLNQCPVYASVGGHAYGWVYQGPLGAAVDPAFIGLAEARHLPSATPMCGACEAVCPVKIPLTSIFRHWRSQAFTERLSPRAERAGLALWSALATRPRLYQWVTSLVIRTLSLLGRGRGAWRRVPLLGGWTRERDLPKPEGRTFFDQLRRRRRR